MTPNLSGISVAILVADGFSRSELHETCKALLAARAQTYVVSINAGKIRAAGLLGADRSFRARLDLRQAALKDFDGLVLPGGLASVDKLRSQPAAMEFVRSFFRQRKPVAAVGQGVAIVLEVEHIQGRRLACPLSVKEDVRYAAGEALDRDTVVDGPLLTGPGGNSMKAFLRSMLRHMATSRRRRPARGGRSGIGLWGAFTTR
jgi:protease I